jgi:hypothetical protein
MYTASQVERTLKNYLAVKSFLAGNVQQLHDATLPTRKKQLEPKERPLGYSEQEAWPFHEARHARPPRDGKAKARSIEDLHCAILDIEDALSRLPDDDLALVYRYHIFQTHTLDELVAEIGLSSKGSMQRRMYRIVKKMARDLERRSTYD